MESPWDCGTKVFQTVLVTWLRWPQCQYMVKTLKTLDLWIKSSRPMTLKLCMQHRMLEYHQMIQLMTLRWSWSNLRQGEIWSLMLLYRKKGKTIFVFFCCCFFSPETIVVYDLKLATEDRSDNKFLVTSNLSPLGTVCPLHQVYIHVHVLNHEKQV